jgi:hypothetical protein
MGPRFAFAALIIAFGIAITFATLTTIRHVQLHTTSAVGTIARS